MVQTVLRGQRLDGYILGTKASPPEFLAASEGNSTNLTHNPDYEEWVTIDQALLGWLYSSMEPSIACDVLNLRNSRNVWKALEERYGVANKARISQLKRSLQNTRKNTSKMVDYLATMKQIADNLSLAGDPISESSLISSVLTGLDAEFLPVTCQLNGKSNLTWQETHATLLAFENQLLDLNIISHNPEVANATANLGENLVSWSSKKQTVVARSSAESEYRSLAQAAVEIAWLNSLLSEIKISQKSKPIIWCDSLLETKQQMFSRSL